MNDLVNADEDSEPKIDGEIFGGGPSAGVPGSPVQQSDEEKCSGTDVVASSYLDEAVADLAKHADVLPTTIQLTREGLIAEHETKHGKEKLHLCGPLVVSATIFDPFNQRTGRQIDFIGRTGRSQSKHIWDGELHRSSSAVLSSLADLGLYVSTASPIANRILVDLLNTVEPSVEKSYVSRSGWLTDQSAFVFGGKLIGSAGVWIDPACFHHGVVVKGDRETWSREVAAKCSGNPVFLFAICLALAGPTFRLLGQSAFGVHFFGPSSVGKTTTARVAASVFGPGHTGRDGFMMTWRSTDNALENALASSNDLLLVLDEIGEASVQTVERVSYMAANGKGKARANASGGLREGLNWRVPILSTGEDSISDFAIRAGRTFNTGQNVRMLSVPISDADNIGDPFRALHGHATAADLSAHFEAKTAQHCGHLGEAFIQALCSDYIDRAADLNRLQEAFLARFTDLSGIEGRVLKFFAVIAAAGALGSELGLVPQSGDEIAFAVAAIFERWRNAAASSNVSETDRVVKKLHEVLSRYGHERFLNVRSSNGLSLYDAWGLREDATFWFTSSAFSREVMGGKDPRGAYVTLLQVGVLEPRPSNETTWIKKNACFGTKQVRCIKINVDRLNEIVVGAEVPLSS